MSTKTIERFQREREKLIKRREALLQELKQIDSLIGEAKTLNGRKGGKPVGIHRNPNSARSLVLSFVQSHAGVRIGEVLVAIQRSKSAVSSALNTLTNEGLIRRVPDIQGWIYHPLEAKDNGNEAS